MVEVKVEAQAEASNCTKPRPTSRRRPQPAQCVKNNGCTTNHVIDIASLEELFLHDGPLLAEERERHWIENDAAISEPDLPQDPEMIVEQKKVMEDHLKKVMEDIKARKQDEVRQRFDCAKRAAANRVDLLENYEEAYDAPPDTEQIVKDTMASLQAAKERLEVRERATAALEAAAARAAKTTAGKAETALIEVERAAVLQAHHTQFLPTPAKNAVLNTVPSKAYAQAYQANQARTDYKAGDKVEVWSKSQNYWSLGEVEAVDELKISIVYGADPRHKTLPKRSGFVRKAAVTRPKEFKYDIFQARIQKALAAAHSRQASEAA